MRPFDFLLALWCTTSCTVLLEMYPQENTNKQIINTYLYFTTFYSRNVILLDRTLCWNHWRINLRKHFGFVDSPNDQVPSKCQQSTCRKPSRHRSVILWAWIWTRILQIFWGQSLKMHCTVIFHKIHVVTFSHGGIILAKWQFHHSYTFWTLSILVFIPVANLMHHPLCISFPSFAQQKILIGSNQSFKWSVT